MSSVIKQKLFGFFSTYMHRKMSTIHRILSRPMGASRPIGAPLKGRRATECMCAMRPIPFTSPSSPPSNPPCARRLGLHCYKVACCTHSNAPLSLCLLSLCKSNGTTWKSSRVVWCLVSQGGPPTGSAPQQGGMGMPPPPTSQGLSNQMSQMSLGPPPNGMGGELWSGWGVE